MRARRLINREPCCGSCAAGTEALQWEGDVCRYQRGEHARVEAPAGAPPIVLLPGFGNCTQDYVAPFGDEEAGVAAVLQVGRGTAGLGWVRCWAGHASEACSTGRRYCTRTWAHPPLLPPTLPCTQRRL